MSRKIEASQSRHDALLYIVHYYSLKILMCMLNNKLLELIYFCLKGSSNLQTMLKKNNTKNKQTNKKPTLESRATNPDYKNMLSVKLQKTPGVHVKTPYLHIGI